MARLRSGMVKVRSSAEGSTVIDAASPNASSSASRAARVERRPVDLFAAHLEAAGGGGFDRAGAVDAVGHEETVADRLLERLAEGGLGQFEEAQRVADKGGVVRVRVLRRAADQGRGGEPDLHRVEVVEHAAVLAVDAAVALVDHDQVEVAGAVVPVLVDHGLQGADRNLLVREEPLAGTRHAVGGERRHVLGEGVLGLLGERGPVDEEEGAA